MNTLGDELPKECERVRNVLEHYKEIGPAGAFGAAMIEISLLKAEQAINNGDVTKMIIALNDLMSIK